MNKRPIPIFYACDDNFVKYTIVSLSSMIRNASKDRRYDVHILGTDLSNKMKKELYDLRDECFSVSFDNVSEYLLSIEDKFPLRDYYSKTTYYRFFISEMYPELDKAIYIDSDTIVQGDISELYDIDIGDCYLGGAHERAMVQVDVYGTYCEKVVGVPRNNFFNAGLMLMNLKQFREKKVLEKFITYLGMYNFVVTQDEDYLNLICKDRVYWIDQRWNTELIGNIGFPIEEAHIIHYMMVSKPWHYIDCPHADIFWSYAKQTSVYDLLVAELESYTDEERERDRLSGERLLATAISETEKEDNFQKILDKTARDPERVAITKRIEQYEKEGRFAEDVEDDPPTRDLCPGEVDYLRRKLSSRIRQKKAYFMAKKFLKKIVKNKILIVDKINGLENLQNLGTGAIITCNHFNPLDTFALHLAYMQSGHKKRKLYRIIREGNYTSFPGFYGYLMRNFYTLPLAKNHRVLKEFLDACSVLLNEGNFLLIYPEQSMWWNYRKPKPMQGGAFSLAVKNNVPILPVFITMKDTDTIGNDGFPVQEYTIHISEPIHPETDDSKAESARKLAEKNFDIWKRIYEKEYSMPLSYES